MSEMEAGTSYSAQPIRPAVGRRRRARTRRRNSEAWWAGRGDALAVGRKPGTSENKTRSWEARGLWHGARLVAGHVIREMAACWFSYTAYERMKGAVRCLLPRSHHLNHLGVPRAVLRHQKDANTGTRSKEGAGGAIMGRKGGHEGRALCVDEVASRWSGSERPRRGAGVPGPGSCQDNPRVPWGSLRIRWSCVCVCAAHPAATAVTACVPAPKTHHQRHKKQGAAHPTRERDNSAVQRSAVQPAKCPRHPSKAKQGDNRSRVKSSQFKSSQSSQPSPVVRSPSPLPTANPPESALPVTGAANSASPPPRLLCQDQLSSVDNIQPARPRHDAVAPSRPCRYRATASTTRPGPRPTLSEPELTQHQRDARHGKQQAPGTCPGIPRHDQEDGPAARGRREDHHHPGPTRPQGRRLDQVPPWRRQSHPAHGRERCHRRGQRVRPTPPSPPLCACRTAWLPSADS